MAPEIEPAEFFTSVGRIYTAIDLLKPDLKIFPLDAPLVACAGYLYQNPGTFETIAELFPGVEPEKIAARMEIFYRQAKRGGIPRKSIFPWEELDLERQKNKISGLTLWAPKWFCVSDPQTVRNLVVEDGKNPQLIPPCIITGFPYEIRFDGMETKKGILYAYAMYGAYLDRDDRLTVHPYSGRVNFPLGQNEGQNNWTGNPTINQVRRKLIAGIITASEWFTPPQPL